jgi:hypothetical protein
MLLFYKKAHYIICDYCHKCVETEHWIIPLYLGQRNVTNFKNSE